MNGWIQDLRSAVRQVVKTPGVTAVVIITIALGVGANTALFSVVNGVLLNPLPYPQPDQLVTLHQSKPNFNTGSISFPNFRDWHKDNQTFSSMAISRGYAFSLTGAGEAIQVNGQFVTSDYFKVMGIPLLRGRAIDARESEAGGPVLVINQRMASQFWPGEDPVGKRIRGGPGIRNWHL